MLRLLTILMGYLSCCHLVFAAAEFKGGIHASYVQTNDKPDGLGSWLEEGTGVVRYDQASSTLDVRQGFLEANADIFGDISANLTTLAYSDGEKRLGVTEAFLQYNPLSQGWLTRYRAGVFYPVFSTENSAAAWQSPYTYSYSAINSWIGEELRIKGIEAEFVRLGRRHRQSFDLSFVGAVYMGNDPLGTLLSWRGWAIHDRQSLLGERVEMANYRTLNQANLPQPTWVQPFEEIDNRPGYYLGVHYKERGKHDLRVYWYDNLADPKTIADNNQYSWRTKFGSIAWQYKINHSLTLLTQVMSGSTTMGGHFGVGVDFFSGYAMLSQKTDLGRFSLRFERFAVSEFDGNTQDLNDSDGNAIAAAWRFPFSEHIELGAEYLSVDTYNENQKLWGYRQTNNRYNQWQLVISAHF